MRKTEDSLLELPNPPSEDAFSEVMHVLSDFCRDLSRHMEGVPREDGLLQAIAPAQEKFKKAILGTAPPFRHYKRKHSGERSMPEPDFLSNEGRGPSNQQSRWSIEMPISLK